MLVLEVRLEAKPVTVEVPPLRLLLEVSLSAIYVLLVNLHHILCCDKMARKEKEEGEG